MRLTFGEFRGVVHGDELDGIERLGAAQLDFTHVADVEDADARAHGHVLGNQAGVFHRHVPAAKVDHLGAALAMSWVERCFLQCRGGRGNRRARHRTPV